MKDAHCVSEILYTWECPHCEEVNSGPDPYEDECPCDHCCKVSNIIDDARHILSN